MLPFQQEGGLGPGRWPGSARSEETGFLPSLHGVPPAAALPSASRRPPAAPTDGAPPPPRREASFPAGSRTSLLTPPIPFDGLERQGRGSLDRLGRPCARNSDYPI